METSWEQERSELLGLLAELEEVSFAAALSAEEMTQLVPLAEAVQEAGWSIDEIEELIASARKIPELNDELASTIMQLERLYPMVLEQ